MRGRRRGILGPRYLSFQPVSLPWLMRFCIPLPSDLPGFVLVCQNPLEKQKVVAKMLSPVRPVMAAGGDLEGVGNFLLSEHMMQILVAFEQSVVLSAVETEGRQLHPVAIEPVERVHFVFIERLECAHVADEMSELRDRCDRRMGRDAAESLWEFRTQAKRTVPWPSVTIAFAAIMTIPPCCQQPSTTNVTAMQLHARQVPASGVAPTKSRYDTQLASRPFVNVAHFPGGSRDVAMG